MKKVLIGLGIGCGVLMLVGFGLVVAGGLWVKNKVGGAMESTQKIQAQEMELQKLAQAHAFQAPAQGEVLALDAKRLDAYLAVREGTLPVFKAFEAKAKEIEAKYGGKKDATAADISGAMEAMGLMMGLVADVRGAYIQGLTAQGMSPAEFQSITQTLYASAMVEGMGQMKEMAEQGEAALAKQVAELEKKLEDESLSEEARAQVEEMATRLQEQIDALNEQQGQNGLTEEARKVAAANMELLKKYEERLQVMANVAFDGFVMSGASLDPGGMGAATAGDME